MLVEILKVFSFSVHNPYFLCPHMTLTRCRGTIVPCASKVSRACCSDNSEGHVRVFCGPNICEGRCLKVPISFLWLPEVLFFWLSSTFFAVFPGNTIFMFSRIHSYQCLFSEKDFSVLDYLYRQ